MGSIGAPELIIVLLVVLLLFGSTKLPKLARSIGEASKEFKKGVSDGASENEPPATATPQATAAPPSGDSVTLTRAEYEALRAQRDQPRKDTPPLS